MTYTASDIRRIMRFHPTLCAFGFRDVPRLDDIPLTDPAIVEQINDAARFIRQKCEQTARFQRKQSSYSWKHAAEHWLRESLMGKGYVANGAFITAAMLAGYRVERDSRSLTLFSICA